MSYNGSIYIVQLNQSLWSCQCWWWAHNFAAVCVFGDFREGRKSSPLSLDAVGDYHSLVHSLTTAASNFSNSTQELWEDQTGSFFHYIQVLEFTLDDSWIVLKGSLCCLWGFTLICICHIMANVFYNRFLWWDKWLTSPRSALCKRDSSIFCSIDVSLGTQGKFGYNEPCRVKHPQMSQCVISHCGLYYRALPGEGVFLVKNVIGSITAMVHYISVTSYLSSKDCKTFCMKHLQQKQASTLFTSWSSFSSSSHLTWEENCSDNSCEHE